jgi:hypothetical protein
MFNIGSRFRAKTPPKAISKSAQFAGTAASRPVDLTVFIRRMLKRPFRYRLLTRGSVTASKSTPIFLSRDCEGAVSGLFSTPLDLM